MKATGIVRRIDDLGRVVIPQGDPPHHENPRGRPVTDNIGTVGKILLRHAGSVKKMGTGLYIVTEGRRPTVGIREG